MSDPPQFLHASETPNEPVRCNEPLRIAIIGGAMFGTETPHAGGLEQHTDTLATALTEDGHDVTVIAGPVGAGRRGAPYRNVPLVDRPYEPSPMARRDVSMPPEQQILEHDAYLRLLLDLDTSDFHAVHNNSLHHLPVVMPPSHRAVVHTLHTPPTPWLESAHRIRRERWRRRSERVVSVSASNADRWSGLVDEVVLNGVDTDRFVDRGGGDRAVFSGRLVAEKAPHLAIDAARRAGLDLVLAGPIHDPDYFDAAIRPRLGGGVEYAGHLATDDLAALVGCAQVALVTPAWDEPFGLVVVEAFACGTPVAAFDRGAMSELLDAQTGRLAPFGDVDALAQAAREAATLDRAACRRRAVERFGRMTMARRYAAIYRDAQRAA